MPIPNGEPGCCKAKPRNRTNTEHQKVQISVEGEIETTEMRGSTKRCRSNGVAWAVFKMMCNYIEMHLHRASAIAAIETIPRGRIRTFNKSLGSPQWV
jgi:hypothetical protein